MNITKKEEGADFPAALEATFTLLQEHPELGWQGALEKCAKDAGYMKAGQDEFQAFLEWTERETEMGQSNL